MTAGNPKIEYLKALIASLAVAGVAVFRDNVYEYMPKQFASELKPPRAVIRDMGILPEADESRGHHDFHQDFVTRKRSAFRLHHTFQIDLWLSDLDAQVTGTGLGDQAAAYVCQNDILKLNAKERAEVEYLGCTSVEDETDDYYKIVLRLKFIQDTYRVEHIPLLPAENKIQIEVRT